MNKTEKLIVLVLGIVLAWWIFVETPKRNRAQQAAAQAQVQAMSAQEAKDNGQRSEVKGQTTEASNSVVQQSITNLQAAEPEKPSVPEKVVTLENAQLKLEVSSWGAVIKKATLKEYAHERGPVSEENPAVTLDFASAPIGAIGGLSCVKENTPYTEVKVECEGEEGQRVTFRNEAVERTITLGENYRVTVEDTFLKGWDENAVTTMGLGAVAMGDSKNDLLSMDSLANDAGKGKPGVIHHCEGDSPLKGYLVGGIAGGCSGAPSAANLPRVTAPIVQEGPQRWIAMKNRFFVVALASCDQDNLGFEAQVARDMGVGTYRPESVSSRARFGGVPEKRTSVFYVGPKKQAYLWDLGRDAESSFLGTNGMKEVMEFGMWSWLCYPLVWVLNFFNDLIPNYGVAIILLTILVRILFWPLTRKSTEGMKRMTELQPLMKELREKYKDNPQRMQQETWQLYRDKKVNPMSSCLPMLIQIPIFIALFNVLRSAVELRYASFLWIGDLSQPEALGATSWFPFFGGLNILPILMAVSTALQSAFTPSTGDRKQQRMMMLFMPLMMLFMFYSFPSALSLYWFLSNVFSIVQMWIIRRQSAPKSEVLVPEVIDPPETRQMRRHA